MSRQIHIFDTTLRDGEQSPGAKCNAAQKLRIARQLVKLNVDIIETGFPASSPGELEAVSLLARQVREPVIAALARAVTTDIDVTWQGIRAAARPRLHIVLGASDIHINKKFRRTRDECLELGVAAVKYAKHLTPDVQYSTEDASRSDFEYLCRVVEAVIKAGATVINIPDTVGYAIPEEFGSLFKRLCEHVPATDRVKLSVHCHNDLGLATANTLAAVANGAGQIEVTVNGIGERAGNAALEEVVMLLHTRQTAYQATTGINTRELLTTSRLVSSVMGIPVQPNKAIVGSNAFAHSSGIHQDGLLKDKSNYEIIDPCCIGAVEYSLNLTARSGRHAVRHCLNRLGYQLADSQFESVHRAFLAMADKKKEVTQPDLIKIVENICGSPAVREQDN